jgi:predicted MFS family arabinose efflux permease
MAVVSLFGLSLMTLLPAWSVDVLGGDVRTNGLLLAARGLGAMSGALLIASLGRKALRGKLWTIGSFGMPVAMMAFAAARWLPVSVALMVAFGWSFMVIANSSNALVQTRAPDELRGRVMSVYSLLFFGTIPFGSLLAGGVAQAFSPTIAVVAGALVTLAFTLFIFLVVPSVRTLEV